MTSHHITRRQPYAHTRPLPTDEAHKPMISLTANGDLAGPR
jgi:hypothetical protein